MSTEALRHTVQLLELCQHKDDGDGFLRGEFPMLVQGSVNKVDHNFLSGYALLHIACALHHGELPADVADRLRAVLLLARELPARYQSASGTANWYAGIPRIPAQERFRGPHHYPWQQCALHLHDDYDDTAVCALLSSVGGLTVRQPFDPAFFHGAAFQPGVDVLAPKSVRRLELTECGAGVYTSWALSAGDPIPSHYNGVPVVALPQHNSVELTTVANVATAVRRLGADNAAQEQSRCFVNRLTRLSIAKLIEGDASYLDFASSYYPRVPFAPLGFLMRDHVLSGFWLLDDSTMALIRQALLEVSPHAGWRRQGFANPMYWLHCTAWYLHSVSDQDRPLTLRAGQVLHEVLAEFEMLGDWPDIEFFHGAHLGDYSGPPYARALAIETLAVLPGGGRK